MYPDEVRKLFPESRDLQKFNIRGYVGTPLRNFEGQVVGILGILTRKPLILPSSALEIIDIIAVKAAAETGRRNALSALRESERKFRTIFENSPYPIAINSYPDHKFLEVNKAFLNASGYTEAEILGKNPIELGLLSLMDSARLVGRMVIAGRLENVPLALEFASLPKGKSVPEQAVKKLKKLSGAAVPCSWCMIPLTARCR